MNLKKKQKYRTEIAFHKYVTSYAIIRPHELDFPFENMGNNSKEIFENSHIYFITSRPRIGIEKDTFTDNGELLSGNLFWHIKDERKTSKFTIDKNKLVSLKDVKFRVDEYPFTDIIINYQNQDKIRVPVYNLMNHLDPLNDEFRKILDLHVDYIGQTFGENGERYSQKRLLSHSTFQKILADIMYKKPEYEIYLIFFVFSAAQLILSTDGTNEPQRNDDESHKHRMTAIKHQFNLKDTNKIVEASLINYFKPYYNTHYKENISAKKHKSLKDLNNLDIQAVILEINLEDIDSRIYSENVKRSIHHQINIDLSNDNDRRNFFKEIG